MFDELDCSSWIRAYTSLLAHASELRGHHLLNPATLDVERWPHTTGADIVLIASVVDPIASDCEQYGTAMRWRRGLAELDPVALRQPSRIYPDNRAFWRHLASTCADLHAARTRIPSEVTWRSLFAQLALLSGYRNASDSTIPPFGPFPDAKSYGDIYRAQAKLLLDKRGFDLVDAPPDHPFGGAGAKIPRATLGDVRALVAYWNPLVVNVASTPGAPYVIAKWQPLVTDVESRSTASSTEIYVKNNDFWRELPNVASKVSEAINRVEANKLDLGAEVESFLESLKKSVSELPGRLASAAHAVERGAEKAAHEAGKVVREAAGGALSGLGTPLLLGAAAVVGVLLLTRGGHDDKEKAS